MHKERNRGDARVGSVIKKKETEQRTRFKVFFPPDNKNMTKYVSGGRRNPPWLRCAVKERQTDLQMCLEHASSFTGMLSGT